MKKELFLSSQSQELIWRYESLSGAESLNLTPVIDIKKLLAWLVTDTFAVNAKLNETQYIAAALSCQLLNEVYLALHDEPGTINILPVHKNYGLRFYFIAAAGAFVAACDGFDAIHTLLSSFFVFPSLIFCSAIIFASLSVVFFYCLNIERIAEELKLVSWTPKLLDLYFLQLTHIKAIHKKINRLNLADLSVAELEHVQQLMNLVHKKYLHLIDDSKPFLHMTTDGSLSLIKKIMLSIAGVFFFSTGFSTGQSVIAALLGLFFAQTTFVLPIIIFSLGVAFAAFSFFWWLDKHDLNKSVSNLLGFNKEKIMQLCDQETVDEQKKELIQLDVQINSMLQLKIRNEQKTPVLPQDECPAVSLPRTSIRMFFNRVPESNLCEKEDNTIRPRAVSL